MFANDLTDPDFSRRTCGVREHPGGAVPAAVEFRIVMSKRPRPGEAQELTPLMPVVWKPACQPCSETLRNLAAGLSGDAVVSFEERPVGGENAAVDAR